MQLEYNPIILPFVVSLIITASLAAYALQKRTAAAKAFVILMVALTVQTFCYVMGLSSVTLAGKIFWLKMKYLGSAPAPVAWFVFALRTTNKERWLSKSLQVILLALVTLTWLVVFTNDYHQLIWKHIFLVPGIPEEQTEHGPYFSIYAGTTYLFTLISVFLYFNYYRTTPAFFRKQALLLIVGGFLPAGSHMAEALLGMDFIPQVDEVIFVFLLSGILFALALFRYSALNIVHIAQNLVVQNISAGIIVLDVFSRVVDLNPYAQELFETTHSQAVGKTIEDAPASWRNLALVGGSKEIAIRRRGEQAYFFVQSSEIKEENGTRAGQVIVLFDISARKNAELHLELLANTLRESRDQVAAQAAQLELQNQYLKENVRLREEVDRISRHDLKTPLNSIIAVPRLLREQKQMDREDDELLTMVERAGYRLLSMVNLSLDLFKIEQGTYRFRPRAVDLVDLLEKVAADIRTHAATKNVELRIRVNGSPAAEAPRVYAWAEELLCYSIAANLLKNALEASPEGGVVTMLIEEGEPVLLRIHNHGAVPEAIRATFFEKYATAGKAEGTGLGTYSARLMARTQDGDILMNTSEEEGTTLTWHLRPAPPLGVPALADQTNMTDSPAGVSASELPALKVLVVDDDEYNLLVMRRYLPTPPLSVETAVNGRAALDAAALNPPDVIFMDLEMPVMNGIEATKLLRVREQSAKGRRCVIIGLSSHDDEGTHRRSLEAGCDLYLTKPVTREELRGALLGLTGPGSVAQPQSIERRIALEPDTPALVEAEDAVCVDSDLRDSLPSFLRSRREAIDGMKRACMAGDADELRQLAHRLSGSLALYGFRWAASHCQIIEREADRLGRAAIEEHLALLRHHLGNVPVRFVDLSDDSNL
jgi:signal transduction histidine kinase/DNA-binding NarL/FixJ family response regulator